MAKYQYEQVKQLFLENNLELLSEEYKNNNQKLNYKCLKCNYIGEKRLSNLLQGKKCIFCIGNLKYTYDEVKLLFLEKSLELLSGEYKNNSQKLRYKCMKCEYIGEKSLAGLKITSGCSSCVENLKYTHHEAKQLFLENNLKLLSKEYKNNSQRLKYECLKCNRTGTKSLKHLSETYGCNKCGAEKGQDKKRYEYSQVKQFFLEKDLKLLSNRYKNNGQRLKYRCLKCGYVGKKSLGHLEHNCNWYNMELTSEDRINRRNIPEYREWAKKIKQKDNYTCQKCKNRGGIINSHHKNGWSSFPDQRYLESNGVTLCKICHTQFHHTYGNRNNISSQTDLFLMMKG